MNPLLTSHRRLPFWRGLLRTRSLILSLPLTASLLFPARPQAQVNDKDQAAAGRTSQNDRAAQEARQAAGLDLEQLANMSMNVTSVTRKSEALFDAPAAIFVLTSEDIRR